METVTGKKGCLRPLCAQFSFFFFVEADYCNELRAAAGVTTLEADADKHGAGVSAGCREQNAHRQATNSARLDGSLTTDIARMTDANKGKLQFSQGWGGA